MLGGMELEVAEEDRGSTSDNDRGKRLTACPGTQGTNLAARRCSEDLRRGRLGPDERSLGSGSVPTTTVRQYVEYGKLSQLQINIAGRRHLQPWGGDD